MRAMRELPVAPIRRKSMLLPVAPNQWHVAPSRAPQEGRFAIVTDVGRGMRWTRWPRQTSDVDADGEVVWSWRPLAGVKSASDDPQMTVTKTSWTPGRARRKPLKPIAQGMPVIRLSPVVTCLCASSLRTQGCGCRLKHPAFPAPSVFRGTVIQRSGRDARRGNMGSWVDPTRVGADADRMKVSPCPGRSAALVVRC
jgi:hypothetical protein